MSASPVVISMMERLRNMDNPARLGRLIAYHAAPTIAGMTPANLVCLSDGGCLTAWRENRARFRQLLGIELEELKGSPAPTLILCYRPALVRRALGRRGARRVLAETGYGDADADLKDLLEKLGENCRSGRFPHEIGLFLGYPPRDVRLFMRRRGSGARLTGCWRAYHNIDRAARFFARCRAVKDGAARLLENGTDFAEVAGLLRQAI